VSLTPARYHRAGVTLCQIAYQVSKRVSTMNRDETESGDKANKTN
jgi:hypothetical protein